MKKTILFSLALLAVIIQSFNAQAQISAHSAAKATVVVPLSIANMQELNFGNIAVSASAGGTVVLDPATNIRTPANGVSLPANNGTVTAATFEVTGHPTFIYTISLPGQVQVTNGSQTMDVTNLVVTPPNGLLDGNGKQTLKVGGTLTVNANQADGTYQTTGTGFTVTVQYQ